MAWNKGLKIKWIKGEKKICINCGKIFSKMQCYQKCCNPLCSNEYRSKYHKQYVKKPNYKQIRKKYDNKYYSSDYYKNIISPKRKKYQKKYKQSIKYKEKKKAYFQRPDIKLKRKQYARLYPQSKEYRKKYRSGIGKNILKMHCRNRRAMRKNVIHNFTKEEWNNKLEQTNGYCPNPEYNSKCSKFVGKKNLTLDHIYPLSKDNEDFKRTGIKRVYTINDVQPLCKSCNSSKWNLINLKGGNLNDE
jgi:5-methylcytosine-specific restriction endonuclease McrA